MSRNLPGPVRRSAFLGAAVLVAAGVIVPAVGATRPPPTVTVQTSLFRFCAAAEATCLPQRDDNYTTTVRLGTRVRWTYNDRACDVLLPCPGHDVVFVRGGGKTTPVKAEGAQIYSMVFKKRGTYAYFCGPHKSVGMTGTIVVR